MNAAAHGRTFWIDVTKSVGIYLVVFSHAGMSGFAESFLWTFHVPLFFFVSGYLTREQSGRAFLGNVGRKLLLPYVLSYLLIALLSVALLPGADLGSLPRVLAGVAYGTHSYPYFVNAALWFLPSLITVEVLYVFCVRRFAPSYLLLLAVSYVLYRQHYLDLFMSIDLSLLGLNYFLAGLLARRYELMRGIAAGGPRAALVAVAGALCTAAAASVGNLWYQGEHYALSLGAGLAGILMVVSASMLLAPWLGGQRAVRALLTFVSSNTLFILCFHVFSNPLASALLAPVALGPPLVRAVAVAALSIALLVPFMLLARRFLPELVGLRRGLPRRPADGRA
ncbi:MAG TPA: acyltransferase family protein [Steroidobacteraceae bacterium]|nr:acyltransferase family protein [Steroidobacteraceae bacterium]